MKPYACHTPAEPPRDGTPVLFAGVIVCEAGPFVDAQPAVGRMRFEAALGEWVWDRSGLSIRCFLDATLHIHGWHRAPAGLPFALVTDVRHARPDDDGGDW